LGLYLLKAKIVIARLEITELVVNISRIVYPRVFQSSPILSKIVIKRIL